MSATETLAKQQDETAAGFHQSWFPLALASDLGPGQVLGRDVLGTRVILYRDATGQALVQSAFCPHLGADLSVGQVIDGQIRCAYHHWRFDCGGRCVDIPAGDKIPPGARIARSKAVARSASSPSARRGSARTTLARRSLRAPGAPGRSRA